MQGADQSIDVVGCGADSEAGADGPGEGGTPSGSQLGCEALEFVVGYAE